jgi:hypothetical protein
MKESEIMLHLLFPTNQETARAIDPGMGAFNDPATLPPKGVFCLGLTSIVPSFQDLLV